MEFRTKASPAARKLAQELGVDISLVAPPAEGQRIQAADVEQFYTQLQNEKLRAQQAAAFEEEKKRLAQRAKAVAAQQIRLEEQKELQKAIEQRRQENAAETIPPKEEFREETPAGVSGEAPAFERYASLLDAIISSPASSPATEANEADAAASIDEILGRGEKDESAAQELPEPMDEAQDEQTETETTQQNEYPEILTEEDRAEPAEIIGITEGAGSSFSDIIAEIKFDDEEEYFGFAEEDSEEKGRFARIHVCVNAENLADTLAEHDLTLNAGIFDAVAALCARAIKVTDMYGYSGKLNTVRIANGRFTKMTVRNMHRSFLSDFVYEFPAADDAHISVWDLTSYGFDRFSADTNEALSIFVTFDRINVNLDFVCAQAYNTVARCAEMAQLCRKYILNPPLVNLED